MYHIWYCFSGLIYHCRIWSILPSAPLSLGNTAIAFIVEPYKAQAVL